MEGKGEGFHIRLPGVVFTGPNVMIYPQKIWFSEVSMDDVEAILSVLDGCVSVK